MCINLIISVVSAIFCIAFVANVLANLFESEMVIRASKPVLMPALMALLLAVSVKYNKRKSPFYPVMLYLALSGCGDVALLFEGDAAFFAGLGCFLVAHIVLSSAFVIRIEKRRLWLLSLPYVLLAAGALWVIVEHTPLVESAAVRVAIAGYALVLAFMAFACMTYHPIAGVGGLFFCASDALLGAERFIEPSWLPESNVTDAAIMLTYGVAQFAIVFGVLVCLYY